MISQLKHISVVLMLCYEKNQTLRCFSLDLKKRKSLFQKKIKCNMIFWSASTLVESFFAWDERIRCNIIISVFSSGFFIVDWTAVRSFNFPVKNTQNELYSLLEEKQQTSQSMHCLVSTQTVLRSCCGTLVQPALCQMKCSVLTGLENLYS